MPENMVPREKMVQILADVHTREAQIERAVVYPDTALMIFNREEKQILAKYDVSEQQFKESYSYYLDHAEAMDKLYETIVDTLGVRETKIKAANGNTDPEENPEVVPAQ
ncbi:DUF4296 domain-containing protein [Pontibacter silvestris]|uniref:DUF4296 domain-containing protein n=1 Tax=Pontibacter silvestris TaxID=2305183 RepID=A0ABW4WU68_9BACT|nr:DUF4296 domain-containing protein [Pontibacter silvestris]MCC9136911.1 DUF4296 domain-containing protein [Pontibacter silvestris]